MKTINIFKDNDTENTDIKSKIINELKNRYGFRIHTNEEEPRRIFYPLNFKYWESPIDRNLRYAKQLVIDSEFSKELQLKMAINKLRRYAKLVKDEDPGYDFIFMGLPVKFYDKFVQIGSHIIPLYKYESFFNKLNEEKKENIINLIINVNNTDIEIAA